MRAGATTALAQPRTCRACPLHNSNNQPACACRRGGAAGPAAWLSRSFCARGGGGRPRVRALQWGPRACTHHCDCIPLLAGRPEPGSGRCHHDGRPQVEPQAARHCGRDWRAVGRGRPAGDPHRCRAGCHQSQAGWPGVRPAGLCKAPCCSVHALPLRQTPQFLWRSAGIYSIRGRTCARGVLRSALLLLSEVVSPNSRKRPLQACCSPWPAVRLPAFRAPLLTAWFALQPACAHLFSVTLEALAT